MTTDVVARAEALLADVTPGEWYADYEDRPDGHQFWISSRPKTAPRVFGWAAVGGFATGHKPNGDFIAASPQLVADLLAEVRRLRAALDGMADVAADALRADGGERG